MLKSKIINNLQSLKKLKNELCVRISLVRRCQIDLLKILVIKTHHMLSGNVKFFKILYSNNLNCSKKHCLGLFISYNKLKNFNYLLSKFYNRYSFSITKSTIKEKIVNSVEIKRRLLRKFYLNILYSHKSVNFDNSLNISVSNILNKLIKIDNIYYNNSTLEFDRMFFRKFYLLQYRDISNKKKLILRGFQKRSDKVSFIKSKL